MWRPFRCTYNVVPLTTRLPHNVRRPLATTSRYGFAEAGQALEVVRDDTATSPCPPTSSPFDPAPVGRTRRIYRVRSSRCAKLDRGSAPSSVSPVSDWTHK